jgi:hypothetical protein
MTPKEKAYELMEKCDGYTCYAEVAVDEIISVLTDLNGIYNITPALTYWQEVKKEME